MKKLFFAFAAGLLLLAGCAKEYDDTALKEKVDAIDKKVTALQAEVDKLKGDVSGLSTVVEAWKNADVITKVEEIKEGDKVTGYTLTFKSGKTISLFNGKDGANAPVIGTKKDGDQLYWTVGGEYLIVDGKKVPVNVVPSFELKDGHLWVTIGGVAQDLGAVSEGSSVDGIIKSIVPGEKTVVFTLNGNPETILEIPLAKPFGFVFEETAFAVLSADPINIPYTLNGKTEKTTIGVFTNANYTAEIDDAKVVVTPPAAGVKGEVLVWAANHEGQSDIAQLTFGPKEYQNTDAAPEDPENIYEDDVDYIANAVDGTVAAHVTTNVEIAVKSEAEWITVGEITKASYTINLVLEDNPKDIIRYGNVKVVLKNDENVVLQDIKIAQAAGEPSDAQGQWVLDKSNYEMNSYLSIPGEIGELDNYTFEVRFLSKGWKMNGIYGQRLLHITSDMDERDGFMLRWSDDKCPAGVLQICGGLGFGATTELSGYVFETNKWYTLSIAGDGANINVYANGEKIHTYAKSGKFIPKILALGQDWDDGGTGYPRLQNFDGYIAYMRVWNVARSESEIKAGLCKVANNAEGLVANWEVESKEKPGAVIPDATGNGHDLDFATAKKRPYGSPVDFDASILANQWVDYTEVICEGGDTPEPPTPGDEIVIDLDLSASATYPADFPKSKDDGVKTGTWNLGGYPFTFAVNDAYYYGSYNGNYFLVAGKAGTTEAKSCYIALPVIENYVLSDALITAGADASTSVKLWIGSSFSEKVTGEWTVVKSGSSDWTVEGTEAGKEYKLYFVSTTSTKNAQLTRLKLVYKKGAAPEPQPVEGKAPYMKQRMFGVTFPEAYAELDNVTMEGWIYPKSFSGAQANLPTFMGTENAFLVRFENSKPQIVLGDPVTGGGEIKASSNDALQTNAWYHIAAVYSRNDKVTLYVNGEQVAQNNSKDFPVTINSGVKSGANDDSEIGRIFWVGNAYSTRWFDGNMSHLRVWNKALTVDEIKASANNKALETAEGLIANWPLTEGAGVSVADKSGNSLNTVFKTNESKTVKEVEEVTWEDVTLPDIITATGIALDQTSLEMTRGDQVTLKVSVTPANALVPKITWESSDNAIATVSGGLVTAKGVGSATITAKATVGEEEIKAECAVTVAGLTGAVAPYMKENYIRTKSMGSFNNVTVEWKMKAKSFDAPTVSTIFGREGQWLLRIGDEGIDLNELQLATNHGNWTTGVKFDADKWYHVAVTYSTDSKLAQVYVNGVKVAEKEDYATAAADLNEGNWPDWYMNRQVLIGTSYDANRWFDGQLCEFRIWDVVRTKDEIRANMNDLADATSENLKAYYKMNLDDANNGDGKTMKDYSPAAKDVTASKEVIWQQGREDVVADPDVEPEPTYTDLSDKQANCYVIDAPGAYKIPALKGNGTESVGTVTSAAIVWETYNNAEEVAPNSVIAKVGVEEGFITFETPATLKPGNALIAAKDADGKILWSWHIWIPKNAITSSQYGLGGQTLMDRNLGALEVAVASATEDITAESQGMLYSWGRKDPFVAPGVVGQKPQAKVAGEPISFYGERGETQYSFTIAESIENPTVFVTTGGDGFRHWVAEADADKAIWAEEKTIYDPCPAGYQVPFNPWDTEKNGIWNLSASNVELVKYVYNGDHKWFTMGDPATVFPIVGYLDQDGYANRGARAYYWSARSTGWDVANVIRVDSSHNYVTDERKSRAGSIRCAVVAAPAE